MTNLQSDSMASKIEDLERKIDNYSMSVGLHKAGYYDSISSIQGGIESNTTARSSMETDINRISSLEDSNTEKLDNMPNMTLLEERIGTLKEKLSTLSDSLVSIDDEHKYLIEQIRDRIDSIQGSLDILLETSENYFKHTEATQRELNLLEGHYDPNTIYFITEE